MVDVLDAVELQVDEALLAAGKGLLGFGLQHRGLVRGFVLGVVSSRDEHSCADASDQDDAEEGEKACVARGWWVAGGISSDVLGGGLALRTMHRFFWERMYVLVLEAAPIGRPV